MTELNKIVEQTKRIISPEQQFHWVRFAQVLLNAAGKINHYEFVEGNPLNRDLRIKINGYELGITVDKEGIASWEEMGSEELDLRKSGWYYANSGNSEETIEEIASPFFTSSAGKEVRLIFNRRKFESVKVERLLRIYEEGSNQENFLGDTIEFPG